MADLVIGVSVAIPEPHAGALQRAREVYGDPLAAKVPPHITLVPPTPMTDEEIPVIENHLTRVGATTAPFRVRLRGTGTFRPVTPVVFVTLAEGIGPCGLLQEKLRRPPLDRELMFPYHPHVTIGHHLDEERLDRMFDEYYDFHALFEVREFWLSEHGRDEVWRPVRAFPLLGATW
ncbi:2'-5' RNA ligase family protein [Actinocorallia populi]|uniref:2'-5' RNA ligase family protein n=1 Tax=Actinocorallia populi TaxID=2079200 RepID=UPI001E5CDCC6|nr:2'-5' RNA ligase family protein [Actinocorallia populi]